MYFDFRPAACILLPPCRVVVFVDEDNGDVDNIPSDGEGLDGDDETSDESEADSSSDVSRRTRLRTESVNHLGHVVQPFSF